MAFEPIYEVAVTGGLQKLCSGQVVAEAKLVPPHGEEITKILGVSATVDVAVTEAFTGEARIKGRVDFKVIYSGSNGDRSLDYRAEFTDKITDDAITGGRPCAFGKVLDTDVVSATESEIRLAAVVEVELLGESSKRIKYLSKGGDNIYSHEQKLDYTKTVGEFSASVEVTNEATIEGNKLECIESRVCVTRTVASTNMAVIDGSIISDVVFSGEGGLGHISVVTPFSVEAEVEGAQGGTAFAQARLLEVRATIVEGDENTILVNYEVGVTGFVLEEKSITPIVDVFSVQNEMVKSCEKTEVLVNKHCLFIEDEANGNITLGAELPIVDNIITPLGSSVLLSNVYALDGKIVIEGLVRTNIIYFSGESNSSNSVAAELPFSLHKPFDVKEGDVVFAVGEVLNVYTKIRRGNEIDVRADLRLSVNVSEKTEICLITELSEGAAIEAPQCPISLHIASKKESLWDVAKALGATPEAVMEQNPELTFPLSGGENVICFRKVNRNQ